MAPEISKFPNGSLLVIRALSGAGKSSKTEIESELSKVLKDLNRKAEKLTAKQTTL